ncbi:MAG: N-acetylglucosaminidase [Anaerorhabdus sp.]|uniref:N-acetylglucosaminidase n=1 Tax=Anaerorhabdus sp. TaxID=1872524 RepID=UPI003A8A2AAB
MVNRIIKLLLSISMIAVSFTILDTPVFNFVTEAQADMTSTSCGNNYEVAIANAGGSFTSKGCYNDFGSAQNAMKGLGDNAVVRHSSSKSPMKIVSMVSGIAVTYPMRSGSSTMNITQDHSSSNKKVTYVTKHREMKYFETRNYNGSGNGTISVNITGFTGTADLMNVDLVPYVMLGNDTIVLLGGNDTSGKNEQPFWTHVYQSHYEVRQNGNNKELTFYAYSGWSNDNWPEVYTMTVGLAADWMVPGTRYYSYDGYNFYSDNKCTNKVGTYYNYYQFLPTRTKSNISASVFDNFLVSVKGSGTNSKMKGQGQTFINAQNTYGMNALLVYSLACLESAYGTSTFALERNNLFGWNAFDSDPGSASYFSSVEAAINEHMGINLRGYTDINDFRFFGSHVGNKGSGFNVKYAADPYWGYKITAIAYSIDKASGFADLNKYSVGVINTYGVNVLKSPNGAVLFNSKYGETYQENFTVAVLANESNHYKIQSTNPVASGNIITTSTKGLVSYDWNQSIGYIPTGYVTMLGGSAPIQPSGTTPTGDFVGNIKNAMISSDGKLTLEGNAYRPGIYVTEENKVTQKLIITNSLFQETEIVLNSNVTNNDTIKYSTVIDLSKMEVGNYYFDVKSEYSKLAVYNQRFTLGTLTNYPESIKFNGLIYTLYDFEGILKLSIKKEQVIIPEPTPTPSDKPSTEVSKMLKQDIISFDYKENNTVLLKGYAFIAGVNAKKDTDLLQEVYLINMETKDVIPFSVTAVSLDSPLALNDGFEYTKICYDAILDLGNVPAGNYTINVKVKNGSDEFSEEMKNYYNQIKPIDKIINNTTFSFVINQQYGYRYELRAENSYIDQSLIVKPTNKGSLFDFNEIKIENSILSIDGIGWIYNVNFNDTTNPVYKLVFVNSTGTKVEKSLTTKACQLDYTALLSLKFDTKKACFSQNLDLSDLANDKYLIYLDVSTTENHDIYELYDYYNKASQNITYNNKNYILARNKTRNRLSLEIK